MREFAAMLHPKMIGLTGSPEQIAAASKAYRTYFKVQDPGDPYTLIDHSTRDVTLGEHPAEPLAVEDRYDPDVVFGHHPAGVGNCRVALEHEEEAVSHDVSKRLHGAPPSVRVVRAR